jgi:GR25 family glycosyltransferase involved in LPS biosynthesis
MKAYDNLLKKIQYDLAFRLRLFDRKSKTSLFFDESGENTIQRIYIINLDRKPERWKQVGQELKRIYNCSGLRLFDISRRFSAIDARYFNNEIDSKTLLTYYSLADQLRIEPNYKVPKDLKRELFCIEMTPQEIAIALSHIEVWKLVANSDVQYTLILEDDVYFKYGFAEKMNSVWDEVITKSLVETAFDILFLSYERVGPDYLKNKIHTETVYKPDCGIWQASGYVLSQKGAKKLLNMLPAYGPIDLWLNLKFDELDVLLSKTPIIEQRFDIPSTNSYSVMPILSQIGVYTHEKPLNAPRADFSDPIFAFGKHESGLTSLAIALLILGFTCCYDLVELPELEKQNFMTSMKKNYFNAYVNIGDLSRWPIEEIINLYPNAKFIYTTLDIEQLSDFHDKILYLPIDHPDKWEILCKFFGFEYPSVPYPVIKDIGQRNIVDSGYKKDYQVLYKALKFDDSPWVLSPKKWNGITINDSVNALELNKRLLTWCGQNTFDETIWKFREDTFPSNLSIFRPDNVKVDNLGVMHFSLEECDASVRSFTSAAIVTQQKFVYGKFSVELCPSKVSGLITGVFLHRNSPHQEIDIEILGKDTTKILVNVFYNPGIEGTKFEYGYRGTPVLIDLGFDAAESFHRYEIEWQANIIRWSVDNNVIYERVLWNPTPIPDLPMEFNVNLWHSRSKELAGKLDTSKIPAQTCIKSIRIEQEMGGNQ